MAQSNENTNSRLWDMSLDELKLELSGEFDPHLVKEINLLITHKTGGNIYDNSSSLN
jgi:hypothetical protein